MNCIQIGLLEGKKREWRAHNMSMFLDQVTIDVKAGKGGEGWLHLEEKNTFPMADQPVGMAAAVVM